MAPTACWARRATKVWEGCRRWWSGTSISPSRPLASANNEQRVANSKSETVEITIRYSPFALLRPPIIEPIVAVQQPIAAHDFQREVACQGCRPLEVID